MCRLLTLSHRATDQRALHTLASDFEIDFFDVVEDLEPLVFVLLLGLGVRLNQEKWLVGVVGGIEDGVF